MKSHDHAVPENGHGGGLSVVIPTKGRCELVARSLASLDVARAELPEGVPFDVVVVDDSQGEERRRIVESCRELPFVTYVDGPRVVAAKRNLGVANAAADYIVFLDSDCLASPAFLRAHYAASARSATCDGRPIGAVAGPTLLDGDPPDWWWRVADFSAIYDAPYNWPARHSEVYWAATNNLAVRRDVFESLGGFDENTFTVVGGEDVELCLRLRRHGYTIACSPAALVIHARSHVRGGRAMLAKMFLYGRSTAYITTRHPDSAEFYANPVSVLAAFALGTSAVAGVRRALALAGPAAAAWWLWDAARLMSYRDERRPGLAAAAVLMEWTFDAGIVAEAVKRGDLRWLAKRFRFFDASYFRPPEPG